MPSRTKAGLNLADRNSYVRVEENINDNLLKIDDDVDATWGGLYGGYIQDETITKEVGKRYIDKFNKKAYICRKPSNVNTTDAYTECNVVSNLYKLQNLDSSGTWGRFGKYTKLSFSNKVQQISIPGDYDPLKLVNNYLEMDLSTYFSEISTIVATPNVIQSQTTLSTTVTETQIVGNRIIRVKFLILSANGSLTVPTSAFRFSINVIGIAK